MVLESLFFDLCIENPSLSFAILLKITIGHQGHYLLNKSAKRPQNDQTIVSSGSLSAIW